MSRIQKKVFVALSGGVDSSVSAALLKKAGYDVTGVFIRVWQPDFLPCSWREERRDAMRVAAKLGIPFLTFNLEQEYKRDVVDYMVREYKAGRTPNPDVMCNKYVKFGAFYEKALKMGADYIATGHYSRNKINNLQPTTYNLLTAHDSEKDQSYFLWTLNQEILSHTLFPIGGYKKVQVRTLAKKFGLFTSEKKDSQGLCFVGKLDMKEFLSHYIKEKRGKVLNEAGGVIGWHNGAVFLTFGERHGFSITKRSPDGHALYVISKDAKNNTIIVGEKAVQSADSGIVKISEANWVSEAPVLGKKYEMQCRYHAPRSKISFSEVSKTGATVSIKRSNEICTPGQSAVFYDGEICLGGGIII